MSQVHTQFFEPDGIAARGTLIVLPSAGETAAVYQRFARRLSFDAYRVVIAVGGELEAATLLEDLELVRPVVLVGVGTGAFAATGLANATDQNVDAVILAGIPAVAQNSVSEDTHQVLKIVSVAGLPQITQRTACPNHQRILSQLDSQQELQDTDFMLPQSPITVPSLAFHGAADELNPVASALDSYSRIGIDQVITISGGLHDILNDITHRSVAASIVLFLEQLRVAEQTPQLMVRRDLEVAAR